MGKSPKLNGHDPLRVFIGASAGGEDAEACAALEAGLRRRASVPIEVEVLRLVRDPSESTGGWRTERWGSPWTALRWAVPEISGWRGRAVYLDPASLVLGDVAQLREAEFSAGTFVLARREGASLLTGCLVLDCAEARRYLPPLREMKRDVGAHQEVGALLERRPRLVGALPPSWGRSDADFARAPSAPAHSVHFTSLHTQPHVTRADARLARAGRAHWFTGTRLPHYCARLVALWEEEFDQAVSEGYVAERYVPDVPWGAYLIGGADRVGGGKRPI